MTDIIANAQKLLDGATPGPWVIDSSIDPYYPELQAAPRVENGILMVPVLIHDVYGEVYSVEDAELIAAAPELAQALAEEAWEYGVEYKYLTSSGAEWRLDPSEGWHKTYRAAERAANTSVRFRIVRRRVSPPEVIE